VYLLPYLNNLQEGGIGFQEGFVPANPPLTDPFGPIILQIPSSRDFESELQYYYSQLPLRPYEEVLAMESRKSNPTEGFTTPIQTSGLVDPTQIPTPTPSTLWRTYSSQDIHTKMGMTLTQPLPTSTPLTQSHVTFSLGSHMLTASHLVGRP
jgi:hypothetical protein